MIYVHMPILKAAILCASTEATRYYLNGVAIQAAPEGVVAVATDGHRLAAFNLPEHQSSETFSIIIPHHIIHDIKLNKAIDFAELVVESPLKASIAYNGQTTIFQPIDGTFPDWKRIIPTELSGEVAQFNPDYLQSFAKMVKLLGRPSKSALPFHLAHNGGGPARVILTTDFDHCCVIMPMRSHTQAPTGKPAWTAHAAS